MKGSQFLIITLLIVNLVATVWFGVGNQNSPTSAAGSQAANHELPRSVNADVRDRLYQSFARAFNAQDYQGLYEMFGPVAKAQIKKEEASAEFKKLVKFFHSVENGGFTHSEMVSSQGSTTYYVLYYAVKLSEASEFGTSGTLKITIAVQGNNFQVFGIRLNAG